MIMRAILIWLIIAALAPLNGALREMVLVKKLGERTAHVVSTMMLIAIVFTAAFLATPWMGPLRMQDALWIGLLWFFLTLLFEFVAGHYLFKTPWPKLLAAYDVRKGEIWVLVPIACFFAPWISYLLKRA